MEEQIERLENLINEQKTIIENQNKKIDDLSNLLKNHKHSGVETIDIKGIIEKSSGVSLGLQQDTDGNRYPTVSPTPERYLALQVDGREIAPRVDATTQLGDDDYRFFKLYLSSSLKIGTTELTEAQLQALLALI